MPLSSPQSYWLSLRRATGIEPITTHWWEFWQLLRNSISVNTISIRKLFPLNRGRNNIDAVMPATKRSKANIQSFNVGLAKSTCVCGHALQSTTQKTWHMQMPSKHIMMRLPESQKQSMHHNKMKTQFEIKIKGWPQCDCLTAGLVYLFRWNGRKSQSQIIHSCQLPLLIWVICRPAKLAFPFWNICVKDWCQHNCSFGTNLCTMLDIHLCCASAQRRQGLCILIQSVPLNSNPVSTLPRLISQFFRAPKFIFPCLTPWLVRHPA